MAKAKTKTDAEEGEVFVSFVSNVPRHTRELAAADFKRAGIAHGKISCGAGEVIKVSSEAADYLVDELGEFERVDPEDVEDDVEETEPATSIQDTVPEGEDGVAAGGSGQGANTRDGAGARSATINR